MSWQRHVRWRKGSHRPNNQQRTIRRWGAVGAAAAPVAALVGFIQDISGLQSTLCRSDGLKPVCRALRLGGLPSVAEENTWRDAQARADGEGYRTYLRTYPDEAFARQAQARLAACRQTLVERWEPRAQRLSWLSARGEGSGERGRGSRDCVPPRGGRVAPTLRGVPEQ